MKVLKALLLVVGSGFGVGFLVYAIAAVLFGGDEYGNYYEATIYAFVAMPAGMVLGALILAGRHFRK